MWKLAAVMLVLMAAFCVPNVVYLGIAPFWRRVQARVVSNRTVYHRSSIEGSEGTRTVASPIIRAAYRHASRDYECELGNAGSLRHARPGDVIDIRVCPQWPRFACLDTPMHPLARLLAVVVWGSVCALLLLGARAAWLH